MTLLAVEPVRIGDLRDAEAVELLPGVLCQNPMCDRRATEAHHVVRRSYAGRAALIFIDGVLVGNIVGVCRDCHDQLSGLVGGHRAALIMPPLTGIEQGLYRRAWVWYALARPEARQVALPPRVLKSGRVLWPVGYIKEGSPA